MKEFNINIGYSRNDNICFLHGMCGLQTDVTYRLLWQNTSDKIHNLTQPAAVAKSLLLLLPIPFLWESNIPPSVCFSAHISYGSWSFLLKARLVCWVFLEMHGLFLMALRGRMRTVCCQVVETAVQTHNCSLKDIYLSICLSVFLFISGMQCCSQMKRQSHQFSIFEHFCIYSHKLLTM